jgi:hypothetical protein
MDCCSDRYFHSAVGPRKVGGYPLRGTISWDHRRHGNIDCPAGLAVGFALPEFASVWGGNAACDHSHSFRCRLSKRPNWITRHLGFSGILDGRGNRSDCILARNDAIYVFRPPGNGC